jgi:hypothetical protein
MRKQGKATKAQVIIPGNLDNPPEQHEIDAAWILARHYNCTVEFLRPSKGYMVKTPDIDMMGVSFEIKSPFGNAKRTIRNNIDAAKAQSSNIVLDSRRTKLSDDDIIVELKREIVVKKSIKRLIMITKEKIVLEIVR